MSDDIELPELPSTAFIPAEYARFTERQIQDYARAAVLADRERRAQPAAELVKVATGEVAHIYQGQCPEPGRFAQRDPECPACRAIETSAQPAPGAWQPIETAPRDGTEYLASDGARLWIENWPAGCAPGRWNLIGDRWVGRSDMRGATIWQPLPEPPKGEKQ